MKEIKRKKEKKKEKERKKERHLSYFHEKKLPEKQK
jgi:hypothetical protein